MGTLEGKVAVITGGASGIGLATAELFLREGARVHILDQSEENLERGLAALRGASVSGGHVDVVDRASVDAAIDDFAGTSSAIDILISNAGISGPTADFGDYPLADFRRVLDVHVVGAFNIIQACLPHIPDGGSIIITSSVVGLIGGARVPGYITAKHAQVGLMRALAAELSGRRIRVNTIHPGPVDNEFQADVEMRATGKSRAEAREDFDRFIPLGRHASNADIAESMLFLAGPRSSMITSTTFRVDGGMAG
jgi:NAD(P)-dependent dehydrogenase (short-subunit alcohol dehydrogenase family)